MKNNENNLIINNIKLMTNNDKIMNLMTNNENNYHYSTLNFINCHYSKVSNNDNAIYQNNANN